VFAKFKIAVGSGELKIKSATGLKNWRICEHYL
jgi:hypothetical protein